MNDLVNQSPATPGAPFSNDLKTQFAQAVLELNKVQKILRPLLGRLRELGENSVTASEHPTATRDLRTDIVERCQREAQRLVSDHRDQLAPSLPKLDAADAAMSAAARDNDAAADEARDIKAFITSCITILLLIKVGGGGTRRASDADWVY